MGLKGQKATGTTNPRLPQVAKGDCREIPPSSSVTIRCSLGLVHTRHKARRLKAVASGLNSTWTSLDPAAETPLPVAKRSGSTLKQ